MTKILKEKKKKNKTKKTIEVTFELFIVTIVIF